ncbi:MAG: metallophosphatase family protein [Lachnoclostridium sp.]|nr:metallophosphatase family protein [Lachnospira sp.]MCM1247204.1 metallophosphatase family protein [Lachnoclostridium sp.]MCM1534575.1 metallophosphatase family protein [Clostridium sp.]
MAGKPHRIAVLSDTHGLLRPEVTEVLKTCEMILHGGDINNRKIVEQLEQMAPLYAVRGNNDKDWAQGMAEELEITLFGLHIYMIHNKKHRKENLKGTDLFIYGHSHKYEEKSEDGVFFLNPGSCGPRRFKQPVTMAVLEVYEDTGKWKVQKIELTQREGETGVDAGGIVDKMEVNALTVK